MYSQGCSNSQPSLNFVRSSVARDEESGEYYKMGQKSSAGEDSADGSASSSMIKKSISINMEPPTDLVDLDDVDYIEAHAEELEHLPEPIALLKDR